MSRRARSGPSRALAALAAACALLGCQDAASSDAPDVEPSVSAVSTTSREDAGLALLSAEERAWRQATDHRTPPDAREVLGPDPLSLQPAGADRFVGLLADPAALVVLDAALNELSREPLEPGAAALAQAADGTWFVGSKRARDLRAFVLGPGGRLARSAERDRARFAGRGVRALAARGSCLYGADEASSALAFVCGTSSGSVALGAPPVSVAVSDRHVLVTSVLGHTATIFPLDGRGTPLEAGKLTPSIDGPLFAAAAVSLDDGDDYVALAGVEDHPLDRRGGSFGHVDSFVYLHRLRAGRLERVLDLNVSELGVVTPKALRLERPASDAPAGTLELTVTGYGSAWAIASRLRVGASGEASAPSTRRLPAIPGITSLARTPTGALAVASPLLDAFMIIDGPGRTRAVPAQRPARPTSPLADREPTLRLGEALFYTTAMGPWQKSEGALSRFTCETCHFEGGIDGRVHATGRGAVTASTKPLFGLANNGPHFTRALDKDLSEMVFAEFRVAAANSGHSEWFDLHEAEAELGWPADTRWLATAEQDALGLRRALLMYLANLPHPRKPDAQRASLTALESRGADAFERRCASCHAPRLVASDPASAVPRKDWDALLLSPQAPIVWASAEYQRTGVLPYVHAEGARTSSLRRIRGKTPLFTNGSAKSLAELLDAARQDGQSFWHGSPPTASASRLEAQEIEALLAFLSLL